MTQRYSGMAGIAGCMPNVMDCYETVENAAASLAFVLDCPEIEQALIDERIVYSWEGYDLGNDYAEIVEIDCATCGNNLAECEYLEGA